MSSTKFHIRFGLLIILVIGLFAVPITIVINKRATMTPSENVAGQHSVITDTQQVDENSQAIANPTTESHASLANVPRSTAKAGEWVIVDCAQRTVTQCPHELQLKGQTPDYPATQTTAVYRGSCRDVSILITSFCP